MKKHLYAIGDIHGEFGQLKQILQKYKKYTCNLIQVGDFGLGFPKQEKHHGIWIPVEGKDAPDFNLPENLKFIAGNHDDHQECLKYPNYLGRFGFNEEFQIFYVSGGFSIDKEKRIQGRDWWEYEELSISEFNECINLYEKLKPDYVISHECPASIRNELWKNAGGAWGEHSRTAQALQAMLEIHCPYYWGFGHHHKIWSKVINGTKFTCAAINQVVKIY